jgi:aspartate kinase
VIVLKFGGSSLDTPSAIAAVAARVRERLAAQPIVVVSAMAKTTRRLLAAAEAAAAGDQSGAETGCAALFAFHREIGEAVVPAAAHPVMAAALDRSFTGLRQLLARVGEARALSPCEADEVAAVGELVASEIIALALPALGVPAAWIDCRTVIRTDDTFTRAAPLEEETARCLRAALPPLLGRGVTPVVGGYVGATREGITTTLGKEGSDFSAALIGASLGATEIQLWTDVDGIQTADPRLVPTARRVRTLSFAESLELSSSGAKKPHPGTLGPAGRGGVPIRILPTQQPGAEGTVVGRRAAARPSIKSIACRSHAWLVHARLREGAGDLEALLARVAPLRPALLVLGCEPGAVLLALDHHERLDEVRAALDPIADLGLVHGRAVVSMVSEDLAASAELVERALAAGREHEPRLVLRGVAAPVVRCLVEDEDLPAVVGRIHERLFADEAEVIP